MVFVGAVCSLDVVWSFSDICNGLMAIPNLICVLILSKEAQTDLFLYDRQHNLSKKMVERIENSCYDKKR